MTSTRSFELSSKGIYEIISTIIKFAERNREDIAFIGLFGSLAKTENYFRDNFIDVESDIDIMIILTRNDDAQQRQNVRSRIENELSNSRTEIIWGDDTNYFYEWRSEGKICIDIELRGFSSTFYNVNQLLSYSIFKNFKPLYSLNDREIKDLIEQTLCPKNIEDRRRIVLTDRKGLIDFSKHLEKYEVRIDPRRIISHILKNITWAESGEYPATTYIALNFLEKHWLNIFGNINKNVVEKLVSLNTTETKLKHKKLYDTTKKLIKNAIEYINSELN